MRSSRCTAVLVVLALPLLLGAAPEKQVTKALRSQLAGDLRVHRALLKSERRILLTELAALVDTAQGSVLTPAQAASLISPLDTFQTAVAGRVDAFYDSVSSRGQSALNAFLALVPAATALPTGITFGDGGALDAALVSFGAQLEKHYPPIRKRIAAFQKACEARSGVALTVLLRSPTPEDYPGFDFENFYGSYSNLSIDIAIGASALDTSGDGLLAVAGSADVSGGPVTVELNGPTSAPDQQATPAAGTGRWIAVFAGPLDEASYVVRARQGTDGQWVSWHIGVR